VTPKKKAVLSRSLRMPEEVLMRLLMYCSSARIRSSSLCFLRSRMAATWEYYFPLRPADAPGESVAVGRAGAHPPAAAEHCFALRQPWLPPWAWA
jgi:hypothetical protein